MVTMVAKKFTLGIIKIPYLCEIGGIKRSGEPVTPFVKYRHAMQKPLIFNTHMHPPIEARDRGGLNSIAHDGIAQSFQHDVGIFEDILNVLRQRPCQIASFQSRLIQARLAGAPALLKVQADNGQTHDSYQQQGPVVERNAQIRHPPLPFGPCAFRHG
jgi:hypothetical protein